jgi:hypothetical protein
MLATRLRLTMVRWTRTGEDKRPSKNSENWGVSSFGETHGRGFGCCEWRDAKLGCRAGRK